MKDWYFFTWESQTKADIRGSDVLAFDGEFDLESAHEYLLEIYEQVGIVTSFRKISEANARGYRRFVKKAARFNDPRRGLRLVKGDVP